MSAQKEFGVKELFQGFVGAFIATLLYYATPSIKILKTDSGMYQFFFPIIGILGTVLFLWIYYVGFKMKNKNLNFAINFVIAFVVSAGFAYTFSLVTLKELFSYQIFGSVVIVATWFGFPSALLFDHFNFINPMIKQVAKK